MMDPSPSGNSDSAQHLAGVLDAVATAETEAGAVASGDGVQAETVQLLTREQFRVSFVGGFDLGGLFMSALKIDPSELDKANAAADAIYDFANEIVWLRFLLDPSSVTVQRIIVIATFVVPKTKAVMREIVEKKKAAKQIAQPTHAGPVPMPKAGPRDAEPTDMQAVSAT